VASIWVDADACPKVVKDILFRAAERTGVPVALVANQPLAIPRLPNLRVVQVAAGFDVADKEIVASVAPGDLVITSDIPLAADVLAKGAAALSPRGERYSPDTIRGLLNIRDFMDTMRASGEYGRGPPPLTQADRNAFASHLDTWLCSATQELAEKRCPGRIDWFCCSSARRVAQWTRRSLRNRCSRPGDAPRPTAFQPMSVRLPQLSSALCWQVLSASEFGLSKIAA